MLAIMALLRSVAVPHTHPAVNCIFATRCWHLPLLLAMVVAAVAQVVRTVVLVVPTTVATMMILAVAMHVSAINVVQMCGPP